MGINFAIVIAMGVSRSILKTRRMVCSVMMRVITYITVKIEQHNVSVFTK